MANLPISAELPDLLYPGQKPNGNVKLNMENDFAKNASVVYINNAQEYPPKNMVTGKDAVIIDPLQGDFTHKPLHGNMTLARSDMDVDGAIIASEVVDCSDAATTPHTVVLIFTILMAPTASSEAIASIASAQEAGDVMILFVSANSDYYSAYIAGAYQYTDIPVSVGERQILAYTYDGNSGNYLYSSAKNLGVMYTNGVAQYGKVNNRLYVGSGYKAQLPCAFEMAYFSYGWSPSNKNDLIEFANDPYQLVIPA